jgi:hypothetical protein
LSANEVVEYPFSKLRVYFYFIGGTLTMIFSIPILLDIYQAPFISLFFYFILTGLAVYASLRLKFYLLRRMQQSEEPQVASTNVSGRRFSLMVFFVMVALFLPIAVFAVLEANLWFLGLVCFVGGFCLSEPLLYLGCKRK